MLKALRWHRPESRILLAFLVLAIAGFAMIKLASEVAEGDTFALDKLILRGLRSSQDAAAPIGPAWLKHAMADFTALGSAALLSLITCCAIGYLAAVRKYRLAGFVALSTGLGAALGATLKTLLARPRPEIVPHLVEVQSLSFPSGHAMNSAIIYLTLAVLLARGQQSRAVQIYLICVAIALVLLVGSSRAYLGVHWPSDILAGWTIGAIWAALCSLISRHFELRRQLDGATDARAIG